MVQVTWYNVDICLVVVTCHIDVVHGTGYMLCGAWYMISCQYRTAAWSQKNWPWQRQGWLWLHHHWWLRLVQCLGIGWISVTVVLKLRPSEVFIQFPAETQESMIRSARQRAKQKAKAGGVVSWFLIIVKTFRQGHDLRWNGIYGAHRDPACRPGENRFIPCI